MTERITVTLKVGGMWHIVPSEVEDLPGKKVRIRLDPSIASQLSDQERKVALAKVYTKKALQHLSRLS